MADNNVTKIYDLKTLGYAEIKKELADVAKGFEKIKKAKKAAQAGLYAAQDNEEAKKFTAELIKQQVETEKLKTRRQELLTEQKAAQVQKQAEIKASKELQANLEYEAGSYKDTVVQMKALYAQLKLINSASTSTIAFGGKNLNYTEATAQYEKLSKAEQDFRRQFTKDKLLVGEYTTGIINAFKEMGLDNIIKGQITKANEHLAGLNERAEQLKSEIKGIGQSSAAAFSQLEKELVENRKEAQQLTSQVDSMKQSLKSTGSVGSQITESINKGFKQLRGQIGQMVLQYVAFTALFNRAGREISEGLADAKQIEGVQAAFERLNNPHLLDGLREATKGTTNDLHLMSLAVQANNFQIPLEQLGTLLQFATQRAKDTGQSVDYLVNSIITGIGRKSPLILDNLGISAVRLKENLGGVAAESASIGDVATAVGKIIQEENAKVQASTDTTAEAIARNQAQWENLRAEFTAKLLPILATVGSVLLGTISILGNIPFPILIIGIAGVTTAIINQYIATSIASKNGIIYAAYLALQDIRNKAVALSTRLATAEITLFNNAIRISPLGILLTILGLVIPAVALFGATTKKTTAAINANNEVNRIATEQAAGQTKQLEALVAIVGDSTNSFTTQKAALEKLISINGEFSKALKGNTIDAKEAQKVLEKLRQQYFLNAKAKAASDLASQKYKPVLATTSVIQDIQLQTKNGGSASTKDFADEQNAIFGPIEEQFRAINGDITIDGIKYNSKGLFAALDKKQKEFIDQYKQYEELNLDVQKKLEDKNKKTQISARDRAKTEKLTSPELQSLIDGVNADIKALKEGDPKIQELQKLRTSYQARLDAINGTGSSSKGNRGSRISGDTRDALKDQDALRDALLVSEETARAKNEISEKEYLTRIQKINDDALAQKLNAIKGNNAAENALRAKYRLDRIKNEQETQDKIYDIDKNALDRSLTEQKNKAEDKYNDVANNPNSTNQQIAQARLDADNEILNAEWDYSFQLAAIEERTNDKSIKNAQDASNALRDITIKRTKDQKALLEGSLKDIQTDLSDQQNKIADDTAIKTTAILNSAGLTQMEKARQINDLEKAQSLANFDAEVAALQKTVDLKKAAYEKGLINQKEYTDAVTELHKKEAEAAKNSNQVQQSALSKLTDSLKQGWNNIKSIFTGGQTSTVEQQQAAMQQSINTITSAINKAEDLFFQSKNNQVDKERDAAKASIQAQEDQALKYADTEAEKAEIKTKYQAMMDEEDRKASEKKKKIALQQASIDFAAAVMKTFAQFGWPLGLIPVAALGIQYAIQRATIQNTQFARGGQVPTRGGKFGGKPHSQGGTPFSYQGNNYEAEVGELAIIRTRNAPANQKFTINGTQEQIASALNRIGGGIDFSRGATVAQTKFAEGGVLGTGYPIPVFRPRANVSDRGVQEVVNIVNKQTEQIQAVAASIIATSKRIDRIEVVQTTSTVTKAQQKQVKQSQMNTL